MNVKSASVTYVPAGNPSPVGSDLSSFVCLYIIGKLSSTGFDITQPAYLGAIIGGAALLLIISAVVAFVVIRKRRNNAISGYPNSNPPTSVFDCKSRC